MSDEVLSWLSSKWGLRAIGCLFFCLGAISSIMGVNVVKWEYSFHNDEWICTTGIVQYVRLDSSTSGRGGLTRVVCDYKYVLNNVEYFSDRVSAGMTSSEDYQAIYGRICSAKDKRINVWVRTKKADDGSCISVLIDPKERTYFGSIFVFLISIGLIFGGCCFWHVSDKP